MVSALFLRAQSFLTLAIAALLLVATPAQSFVNAQQPAAHDSNVAKALNELFAAEWEYQLQQNPTQASSLGDRRWNDR